MTIEKKLEQIENTLRELHRREDDRSKFMQGYMAGVRESVMSKLNRIEKLLVEHHGHNAPPLNLAGSE